MTLLVFGLDGLDYKYIEERGLLADLTPRHLQQDLQGANALFTYRVWPSIFASDNRGRDDETGWSPYIPDEPFIWDEIPAHVLLAPITVRGDSGEGRRVSWNNDLQDEFPSDTWKESFQPPELLDASLDHLESGVGRALGEGVPLVVACTRIPDMLAHQRGDVDYTHRYIERACDLAERMCKRADDYMAFSDHGIRMDGPGGLEDHTRDAFFASSFADFDTMTGLIEGFKGSVHEQVTKHQMQALGYQG